MTLDVSSSVGEELLRTSFLRLACQCCSCSLRDCAEWATGGMLWYLYTNQVTVIQG